MIPFLLVCLLLTAATIAYYAHERWFWHNSENLEVLYWRIFGGFLTAGLLLCEDSPIDVQFSSPFWDVWLIFAAAMLLGTVSRSRLRRRYRTLPGRVIRDVPPGIVGNDSEKGGHGGVGGNGATSDANPATLKLNTPLRQTMFELQRLLRKLDVRLTFWKELWFRTHAAYGQRVVHLFASASPDQLSVLLTSLDMGAVLQILHDYDFRNVGLLLGVVIAQGLSWLWKWGEPNATLAAADLALIHVSRLERALTCAGAFTMGGLCFLAAKGSGWGTTLHRSDLVGLLVARRYQLTPKAKAAVIDALHRLGPRPDVLISVEEVIVSLFMTARTHDLYRLKVCLDSSGSIFNLHRLLFHFLSERSRDLLLHHIRVEAQEWGHNPLHILADIDDTLYSSGGDGIGGTDKRLTKGSVYPGMLSFLYELHRFSSASKEMHHLAFLSARPHTYKSWAEAHSYTLFQRLMQFHGLHVQPTLLPGDLRGIYGLRFRGWRPCLDEFTAIAEKKHSNFVDYASMYPEARIIFVGDSGQGDALAGEWMIQSNPGMVQAVFLHCVQPRGATFGFKESWADLPMHWFDTYVDAAVQAHAAGLLNDSGVNRVARAARSCCLGLMERCQFTSAMAEQSYVGLLRRALKRAHRLTTASTSASGSTITHGRSRGRGKRGRREGPAGSGTEAMSVPASGAHGEGPAPPSSCDEHEHDQEGSSFAASGHDGGDAEEGSDDDDEEGGDYGEEEGDAERASGHHVDALSHDDHAVDDDDDDVDADEEEDDDWDDATDDDSGHGQDAYPGARRRMPWTPRPGEPSSEGAARMLEFDADDSSVDIPLDDHDDAMFMTTSRRLRVSRSTTPVRPSSPALGGKVYSSDALVSDISAAVDAHAFSEGAWEREARLTRRQLLRLEQSLRSVQTTMRQLALAHARSSTIMKPVGPLKRPGPAMRVTTALAADMAKSGEADDDHGSTFSLITVVALASGIGATCACGIMLIVGFT